MRCPRNHWLIQPIIVLFIFLTFCSESGSTFIEWTQITHWRRCAKLASNIKFELWRIQVLSNCHESQRFVRKIYYFLSTKRKINFIIHNYDTGILCDFCHFIISKITLYILFSIIKSLQAQFIITHYMYNTIFLSGWLGLNKGINRIRVPLL